ncbi:MAG TPA: aminotransferase class V-fold PLP-dependent enzyme [Acidimicrobiia bacterium]|nr:aminotransferase class V-fold PLP-dependent enzyme [Acidimicrobiia bacterium]
MIDPAGRDAAAVLADLDDRQAREPDVHGSRLFGLVYPTGREDLEHLMLEVHRRYVFGNALNPFKFPELAALESDVVDHVGALLHVPPGGGGAMTSGGTESILMSMLVNRERAKARGIQHPTIVAPISAHPAYAKAAHYFGLEVLRVPLDADYRADVRAAADLVGPDTAVVIASAFNYPYGIMDPVAELAAIATEHGAGCHVDACVGAFVLPFLERLRHDVPLWDFRVDGVTEISADVHKYGYVPKGASVVLHRDDDWFGHQAFVYDQWPSGLYGSAAMAGARPAAPIATAWAVLTHLGIDGYTEIMRGLMETVAKVRAAVDAMPDVEVVGDPIGPVLALRSDTIDLYAVGDVMDAKGWNLNRNVDPPGLHLMLSPVHAEAVDDLIADLTDAVAHHGTSAGKEIRYS